ncbi:lysylphosphatidylglycerol synthase transmembrane domain-containing protein [Phosphitispora sp. TUW77]|uniref:lysylphosphatidylglycerol synthase transmembrane domain-containing protein n=1 Tax=Phosphitispora sp. TUW77 TaxID=3152361 RepID=UPI003AB3A069
MKYKKILSLILTVFLFVLFFHFINFKQLINMFEKLSWMSVVVATVLYFISNYFRAERFRLLTDQQISLVQMMQIVFFYGFYNKVLPLRTGEISYAVLMKKSNKSTFTESLSALLITRIYDIMSAFLLLLIALFFARKAVSVINPALTAGLLAIIVVTLFNLPGVFKIIELIFHKTLISGRFGLNSEKIQNYSDRITFLIDWFTKANRSRTMLKLTVLSVLIWLSLYGTFFVLMNQLGSRLSYSMVIIGSVFANFSNLLPLSGIGGFGTMEAGWAVGFTLIGLNRNDAIASGIVVNMFIFLCTVCFAACGFLIAVYSKKYLQSFEKEDY